MHARSHVELRCHDMVQGRLIVPLELINGDLIAVDG
jgi:hypothetical protein